MSDEKPAIRGFRGDYAFLSNFYVLDNPIEISDSPDFQFYTAEAAYMSAKSDDPEFKKRMAENSKNPGFCKREGRKVKLVEDWGRIKISVMAECLFEKFKNNVELREKLISTSGRYLEETNTWGDAYWGVCNSQGRNMLGLLLMNVRDNIDI